MLAQQTEGTQQPRAAKRARSGDVAPTGTGAGSSSSGCGGRTSAGQAAAGGLQVPSASSPAGAGSGAAQPQRQLPVLAPAGPPADARSDAAVVGPGVPRQKRSDLLRRAAPQSRLQAMLRELVLAPQQANPQDKGKASMQGAQAPTLPALVVEVAGQTLPQQHAQAQPPTGQHITTIDVKASSSRRASAGLGGRRAAANLAVPVGHRQGTPPPPAVLPHVAITVSQQLPQSQQPLATLLQAASLGGGVGAMGVPSVTGAGLAKVQHAGGIAAPAAAGAAAGVVRGPGHGRRKATPMRAAC
jgi:hypothetical protein